VWQQREKKKQEKSVAPCATKGKREKRERTCDPKKKGGERKNQTNISPLRLAQI